MYKSISVVFFAVLCLPGLISAAVIHVPEEQPNIQAGVNAASEGDTVLVAPGTYTGSGNRDIAISDNNIVLKSELGPNFTIIDCEASAADRHRAISIHYGPDSTTVIEGFTIFNGYAPNTKTVGETGGGILCMFASPKIKDCNFFNNIAWAGGGIGCYDASPVITGCSFKMNFAEFIGSGLSSAEGDIRIEGSIFESNSIADDGVSATIMMHNGSCLVEDCIIRNNSTLYGTAGIEVTNMEAIVRNCRFEGNDGHALHLSQSSGLISENLFLNNDEYLGAGIICYTSSPHIINNTFVGNSSRKGAAVFMAMESNPIIENCLIAFNRLNSGADHQPAVACQTYGAPSSPTVLCSNIFGNEGGDWDGCIGGFFGVDGNISADPLFCDFEQGDFRIAYISPCNPGMNSCGTLIGAFEPACQMMAIEPPQLHWADGNLVNPESFHIYLGGDNFPDSPDENDFSTVTVNGLETNIITTTHPDITGGVMRISVDKKEFVSGYGIIWGNDGHFFTIAGNLIGGNPIQYRGIIAIVGHILGDVNLDGNVDILDIMNLIDYKLKDGPTPRFVDAGEVNCDRVINILDIIKLINYKFKGGPAPDCR